MNEIFARVEKKAVAGASITDVARHANVSIATVSRVINGIANKASPTTIARVRQAIAALEYRPASAGKSLRQKTSRLVAVLAANLANPAMAAIAASIEVALREQGLVMVLCDTHDRPELQDEYLREMLAQQACAIVLLGAVDSAVLRKVRTLPTPVVFVNRREPSEGQGRFVGIDNFKAGKDVAQWALAQGLRNAALVHAPTTSSATRDRLAGILTGFEAAGASLGADMVLSPHTSEHLTIGLQAARQLVARADQPDLVICTSDLIAFGAARAWREAIPIRPLPRMIGFDDSPMNEWLAPTLSSVQIPYDAYGQAIVTVLAQANDDTQIILPHKLVERGQGS